MVETHRAKINRNWLFYLFLGVVITIPFFVHVNSILIALLLLVSFLTFRVDKLLITLLTRWKLLLPVLLFLTYIIGLAYTTNFKQGMSGVEKSLSLLCFPIIGLLINLTETQVKTAVKFFMYACALGAFYCLVVSVISIIETSSLINVSKISDREYYFFINRELTQAIDLDPLYFSMYINFIAAFFFSNPQHLHFKIDFIVLIFLLIFNVLILSLNGIFVFLLLGICFIIKYLLQKKRPKYLYIIICFTSFCFFLAFCFFKPIKNRLTFSTHYNLEDAHIGKWNTVSLRLAIWENSAEVIAENPWIGVGTGDVGDKLNQKYIEKKFALGKLLSFNAHNQFLQTYLMHGIAGFLVLMLLLLIPLWDAFKQRDALLFSFIVIVGLGFLSESIFERQKGIVFFSLFYTMLYSLHLGKAHLVKK